MNIIENLLGSFTVANEEVSLNNENNWKIAATIIHCGTAGKILKQ